MDVDSVDHLYDIFPEILYVVDRHSNPTWRLNDQRNTNNLMLVYEGKAEFTCNNNKFQATRGSLVYYKPGDIRKAHTFPNNLMKCYAVDFIYTCPVYINNEWTFLNTALPFSFAQKIDDEYLFLKLLDLFSVLAKSALAAKGRSKIKERSLLIEILTLPFHFKNDNKYNYSNMRKVDSVINYMTENYRRNITLQELADYSQISSSYLGNIFKKITAKSTIDYLIEIRINKAKSLMRDGFTVSETSILVGFSDIFYFSRAFKKHEGINPSKYMEVYRTEF